MSNSIRRRESNFSGLSTELLEGRDHPGEGLVVRHELELGVRPKLTLSWQVEREFWKKGLTLLVFHNTTGFSTDIQPGNLADHGRLIVEAKQNDEHIIYPPEGTHFYTVVLYKPSISPLFRKWMQNRTEPVRFFVDVPTAAVAIGRIKDQKTLNGLYREEKLGQITYINDIYKAKGERIEIKSKYKNLKSNQKSNQADRSDDPAVARANAELSRREKLRSAKRKKMEELIKSAEYQALSDKEKELRIQEIEDAFDPGESGAHDDLFGK